MSAVDCTRTPKLSAELQLAASRGVARPVQLRPGIAGLRRAGPEEAVMTGQLFRLTIAGQVSQVESRCGNLSHDGRGQYGNARRGGS